MVQQTFMSLVRSKDSISDPLAVVRWLTVSLRRLAWRERANSAKRSGEEPTDDDLPRAPSAEHAAVLTDQQRRLWALVSEMSERCRRLLAVIAFAPRPDYATIAVDLGIPVGSIGPTRGRCSGEVARPTRRGRLDMTATSGNAAGSAGDGGRPVPFDGTVRLHGALPTCSAAWTWTPGSTGTTPRSGRRLGPAADGPGRPADPGRPAGHLRRGRPDAGDAARAGAVRAGRPGPGGRVRPARRVRTGRGRARPAPGRWNTPAG